MKILVQSFLLCLFVIVSYSSGNAQNITGIWRGYFLTDNGEQYKYELQIDQSKKNSISGVSYSYLDTRFYGKATLTGNYTKFTNAALVQEIKTVEVKMAGGSVACIMKCMMTYTKSGKEEFLEGSYTSAYEITNPSFAIKRGGNCGGGKVFLRKVPTSDFYVEPFLRNKIEINKLPKKDSIKKTPVITKTPKTVTKTTSPVTTRTQVKKPVTKEPPSKRQKLETIETKPNTPVVLETKKIEKRITNTPITTRERKNELTKTLAIHNEEIEIRLYDNGEIDDDTVSIYLDNKLIISNKRLSDKPISYKMKMDENDPEHTIVMVAENLGRIPPNTSLLIVQDGDNRYQVSITSTEQKNAMVRFRYQKKN